MKKILEKSFLVGGLALSTISYAGTVNIIDRFVSPQAEPHFALDFDTNTRTLWSGSNIFSAGENIVNFDLSGNLIQSFIGVRGVNQSGLTVDPDNQQIYYWHDIDLTLGQLSYSDGAFLDDIRFPGGYGAVVGAIDYDPISNRVIMPNVGSENLISGSVSPRFEFVIPGFGIDSFEESNVLGDIFNSSVNGFEVTQDDYWLLGRTNLETTGQQIIQINRVTGQLVDTFNLPDFAYRGLAHDPSTGLFYANINGNPEIHVLKLTESFLQSHWPLDEGSGATATDITGNGYDGLLTNSPVWNGNELLFDGIDDFVNVGIVEVSSGKLTITSWVQSDDLENCGARDCRIISKATGTAPQNHYWMLSTIKVGNQTRLRFRLKTRGTTSTLIASSGDLMEGERFHVAATYDGTTMRLYKDGVEVGSLAKTGGINANDEVETWIGGNPNDANSRPWKGLIADVRIYQKALSANEVNDVKNSYIPRAVDDLVARASQDTRFSFPISDSYGENLGWTPDWELRWLDFNFSGNRVVRIFHATNKQDPSIRYTIFNDPDTGEWIGWIRV